MTNDISSVKDDFVLILDDYHGIESKAVYDIVTFLLEYMPAQMHLMIASRSDAPLMLARLRGQNQNVELRAADLCFNWNETLEFFNKAMQLGLSEQDI